MENKVKSFFANYIKISFLYEIKMPYTREFLIGYIRFLCCIGFVFFSAWLLNSHMDTLNPRIQNKEVDVKEANLF